MRIESLDERGVRCVAGPEGLELRPGVGLSGPAIFWAVDVTGFLAVNAVVGWTPAIVLAHGDISFLTAAEPGPLRVGAEVVHLGSRSAVVTARAHDRLNRLVAVATLHFPLPSRATRGVTLAT
jgi:acyl-coenzyme A thioesterase PaaI-like protein